MIILAGAKVKDIQRVDVVVQIIIVESNALNLTI